MTSLDPEMNMDPLVFFIIFAVPSNSIASFDQGISDTAFHASTLPLLKRKVKCNVDSNKSIKEGNPSDEVYIEFRGRCNFFVACY